MANSFTKFTDLALELQCMIWRTALPQGQVITIKALDHPKKANERYFEAIYCFPKILHVCCEARREALLFYKPAFEDALGYPVYLDPKMDTIYIESCDAGGWLDPLQFVTALNDFGDDNELIESLALPTSQPEINFGKVLTHNEECGRHNDITRVFSIVPFCDNLKKIHFIGGIRNGDKMLTNDKELHQKRFWSFFARYANKVYTEADGVMDIKEWFDKWQKLLQDYTLPYIKVISQEDFKAQFDL